MFMTMKYAKFLSALPLVVVILAGVCPVRAAHTTVTADPVSGYDFALFGGKAHVVYATGGNIYYKSRLLTGTTWSDAELIGAGSAPSIASSGGSPYVSFVTSSGVNVFAFSGGAWSPSASFSISNPVDAMIRADASGKLHLLTESGGYGAFNYASYESGAWSALTNLATGWYDSGSGNYYHQARLATAPDASGYKYLFQFRDWGGQASWSEQSISQSGSPSGVPSWSPPSTGWISSVSLSRGALSLGPGGRVAAGFYIGASGYIRVYDGSSWQETSLGSGASDIAVWSDPQNPGDTTGFFAEGGILKQFQNGSISDFLIDSATVSGAKPLFAKADGNLELYYLNSSGALMSYSTIPEPSVFGLATAGIALTAAVRRLGKI